MNQEQLQIIAPRAPFGLFLHLNNAMQEFYINTAQRQAMFLANIAHESGEFHYLEELADGSAYENRVDLGNNLPEAKAWAPDGKAGPWFKGHGYMETTGYFNHQKYSVLLFRDERVLLKNPKQLCEPETACRSAAAFFREEGCNIAADDQNFLMCCQIINMSPRRRGTNDLPNGWVERLAYYNRALPILKANFDG